MRCVLKLAEHFYGLFYDNMDKSEKMTGTQSEMCLKMREVVNKKLLVDNLHFSPLSALLSQGINSAELPKAK